MASIYDLKPAFQRLLRPLANRLAAHHVSPNQITICALIISFLSGALIAVNPQAQWPLLLVPLILLLRMILNAIDGMIAREHHQKSSLGTFLNEIGDVLSDTFLYLPFALILGISSALITVIVILAIISEMSGVVAIQIGASRRYDGPMGKSDRAFAFGLVALLLGINSQSLMAANIIFCIVGILLIVTIINRTNKALQEVKHVA
ncbi:MAG: CDP-alcohol phosphatidyltransferase family protein [Gammaproteobacteria bacterium]|nr:CDP-alcohol phosphatidyltransferase family protein [Gammaproteobacteria bacterium]MCW5582448.1 CDP-alcohol phosphatidyltransferase family protein [Gammaproteobacteria bacterium]